MSCACADVSNFKHGGVNPLSSIYFDIFKSSHLEKFYRKVSLKVLQNQQESTYAGVSF